MLVIGHSYNYAVGSLGFFLPVCCSPHPVLVQATNAESSWDVCFGGAHEIASPRNVELRKHCKPTKLPIDNAVRRPMGRFDRAFRTDCPVDFRLPYTFGNPAFHDVMVSSGRGFAHICQQGRRFFHRSCRAYLSQITRVVALHPGDGIKMSIHRC